MTKSELGKQWWEGPRATPDSATPDSSAWALAATIFHADPSLHSFRLPSTAATPAHASVVLHEVLWPGTANSTEFWTFASPTLLLAPSTAVLGIGNVHKGTPATRARPPCAPLPTRHDRKRATVACVARMGQSTSKDDAYDRLKELSRQRKEAIRRVKDLEPEAAAEKAAGIAPMRGSKQDLHHAAGQHLNLLWAETHAIQNCIRRCCQCFLLLPPAFSPLQLQFQLPALSTCMPIQRARMQPVLGRQCTSRLPAYVAAHCLFCSLFHRGPQQGAPVDIFQDAQA